MLSVNSIEKKFIRLNFSIQNKILFYFLFSGKLFLLCNYNSFIIKKNMNIIYFIFKITFENSNSIFLNRWH